MVSVTDRQDVQGAIIDYTSVVLHRPIPTQFTFPEKRPGLAFSPKKMDLLWIFSFGKNIFPRPNFPTHENPLQCRTSVYFSLELSVTDKRQSNKGTCSTKKKWTEPFLLFMSNNIKLWKTNNNSFYIQFPEEGLNRARSFRCSPYYLRNDMAALRGIVPLISEITLYWEFTMIPMVTVTNSVMDLIPYFTSLNIVQLLLASISFV